MTGRDPFASYRAAMDAAGFKPSRSLGQNFLLDPSLHRWIADAAGPTPADVVLEIGVGLAFLTRELAARAGAVIGVEIDRRLLQIARGELQAHANVTLVQADALGGPGRSLDPAIVEVLGPALAARPGAFLVVANLPYAVAGPLLAELGGLDRPPDRAIVLVQKELAERVAGSPASGEYGGLTAFCQSLCRVRRLRDVPPQVFRPQPKVASAVLLLERDPAAPAAAASGAERRAFRAFLQGLFRQRRKVLRNTLPAALAAAGLPEDGAPPLLQAMGALAERRAEELDPPALWALWRQVREGQAGGGP